MIMIQESSKKNYRLNWKIVKGNNAMLLWQRGIQRCMRLTSLPCKIALFEVMTTYNGHIVDNFTYDCVNKQLIRFDYCLIPSGILFIIGVFFKTIMQQVLFIGAIERRRVNLFLNQTSEVQGQHAE